MAPRKTKRVCATLANTDFLNLLSCEDTHTARKIDEPQWPSPLSMPAGAQTVDERSALLNISNWDHVEDPAPGLTEIGIGTTTFARSKQAMYGVPWRLASKAFEGLAARCARGRAPRILNGRLSLCACCLAPTQGDVRDCGFDWRQSAACVWEEHFSVYRVTGDLARAAAFLASWLLPMGEDSELESEYQFLVLDRANVIATFACARHHAEPGDSDDEAFFVPESFEYIARFGGQQHVGASLALLADVVCRRQLRLSQAAYPSRYLFAPGMATLNSAIRALLLPACLGNLKGDSWETVLQSVREVAERTRLPISLVLAGLFDIALRWPIGAPELLLAPQHATSRALSWSEQNAHALTQPGRLQNVCRRNLQDFAQLHPAAAKLVAETMVKLVRECRPASSLLVGGKSVASPCRSPAPAQKVELWPAVASVSEELAAMEVQIGILIGNLGTEKLPEEWLSAWNQGLMLKLCARRVITALEELDPNGAYSACGARMRPVRELHSQLADIAVASVLLLLEASDARANDALGLVLRYSLGVLPEIVGGLNGRLDASINNIVPYLLNPASMPRTCANFLRKSQFHATIWGAAAFLWRVHAQRGTPTEALPSDIVRKLKAAARFARTSGGPLAHNVLDVIASR